MEPETSSKKPLSQNIVKLVFVSDTHESHDWDKQIPPGDILVHTGDLTMMGRPAELSAFAEKFIALPHPNKILIAGNHDLSLDEHLTTVMRAQVDEKFPSLKEVDIPLLKQNFIKQLTEKGVTYLEDSSAQVQGISFYGSPYTPKMHLWAFQKERSALGQIWEKIPSQVDVLLTHGPPVGILDEFGENDHIGCESLLKHVVDRVKPKIHGFGHVHRAHGWKSQDGILFVNGAICDRTNIASQLGIIVEYDRSTKTAIKVEDANGAHSLLK